MKIIKLITKVIGLLIIWGGISSLFAEQIQVSTTFTCSTNAECKKKCEALGNDHTWKPNPGGSTLGTCTKKSRPLHPSKATLDALSIVTQNGEVIRRELNSQFSKSHIARRLGLKRAQINSVSIIFKNNNNMNERVCATCLGAGFAIEMCCPVNNPNCVDPCWDGTPLLLAK